MGRQAAANSGCRCWRAELHRRSNAPRMAGGKGVHARIPILDGAAANGRARRKDSGCRPMVGPIRQGYNFSFGNANDALSNTNMTLCSADVGAGGALQHLKHACNLHGADGYAVRQGARFAQCGALSSSSLMVYSFTSCLVVHPSLSCPAQPVTPRPSLAALSCQGRVYALLYLPAV